MNYGICFVCDKEINELDDKIPFGLDGDCIHAKCKHGVDAKCSKIDNMSNSEFTRWLLGAEMEKENDLKDNKIIQNEELYKEIDAIMETVEKEEEL